MTADEIQAFLAEEFPQAQAVGMVIDAIEEDALVLRLPHRDQHLRPGGTLSGPTMMSLVDSAFYFLLLARLGPVALAVTTHLSIDFLRRPGPVDLIARAELLKLGRRLAVGRVTLTSEGDPRPVAHASVTYSLPPR